MSAEGSQTAEIEALSRKTEAIERETAALVQAFRRSRNTRLLLFCLLLALIVAICVMFYRLGDRFRSEENMDALMDTAAEQLGNRSDTFLREIELLADSSAPVLQEAVEAQIGKDMHKYEEALTREREILLENLQKRLEKKVQEHQHKILAQHESVLQEEFPQFQDKQAHARLIDNLQLAMIPLLQKFYVDELRDQLQEMYDTWDQFPVADPAGKDDPPMNVLIAGQLLELLTIKLGARPEREEIEEKARRPAAADEKGETEAKKKGQPEAKKKGGPEDKKKEQPEAKKKDGPQDKKKEQPASKKKGKADSTENR